MPPVSRSVLTFSVLLTTAGCSSLPSRSSTDGGAVFPYSAADVVNRAPSSMSVPADNKAHGDDPHAQADYHFSLAETYSLQGDTSRAVEEYKLTAIYDPSSAQVRVRLAAEYVKQGLVTEAVDQAKLAVERDPKLADAHLLLGGLYSALRTYDEAIKEYKTVQTDHPDNTEAPLFVGAILAEQKRFAEAAVQFEALAKNANNPTAHVAWYYLGRVWLEEDKSKNSARAESAFKQSLKLKPSYAESTLALGQYYESVSRKADAEKLYLTFQEKYGPSAPVAEELARFYIEKKDYPSAYEQFTVMEQADQSDLNIKAKMAFILIELQRFPEAIVRLEQVLALEPSSDKIRFYLAAVLEQTEDYKNAITHFEKVPVGSSYYNESILHAAYLYKLQKNYEKAIETVQNGIKNNAEHAPFYALYASLLDDQKEYKKAVVMLADAVVKAPNQAQLYFFLGNMQDRTGDGPGSVASMKKVLDIDKDHVQALNFLAYTYAESGNKLDEAEKMARRALELQPDDGYILDTLGWVMFKRGHVPEAIRTLEAAYKIQPNESVIAEHLGDAYYQNQMPEKAKKLYMRASETETNVTILEKIRIKMAAIGKQVQSYDSSESRGPASSKTH